MRSKVLLHITVFVLMVLSFQVGYAQSSSRSESKDPEIVVTKYINALGERNFKKAYSYIESEQWGDESQFSYNYGGITETIILEKPIKMCVKRRGVRCEKTFVVANYFAKDPSNDIKTCTEAGIVYLYKFLLINENGHWKIISGSLISSNCDPSPKFFPKKNSKPITSNSSPSKNSPAKVHRSDIKPGQSEDSGGQAKQTPNKPTKAKEHTVEKTVFTEIFNPKYWYVYVILVLVALIIGLLSFLPIRFFM